MNLIPDGASPGARREAWSRYWARGMAHSCVGSYGDTYGGTIGGFWQGVFGELPATARVLDIATGNGVLPRMLLDQCRGPGVTCDAVDIATVQLPWLAALPPADQGRVRLHSGVDAAALPFPDRSFDLIVSQYGIEYTDLDRTLPELLRVRALGGDVAMVLHHGKGRPAMLARVEVDHLRWLSREGGYLDATAALIGPMARAATAEGRASLENDAGAHEARERFNSAQKELSARATGEGADVLFEVREAAMSVFNLAGRQGAATAGAALARFRGELEASATRLGDLCDHALDADQARALAERLANAVGVPMALGELLEQGDHLMGWTMRSHPAR